jgi:hypothetical protein
MVAGAVVAATAGIGTIGISTTGLPGILETLLWSAP